MSVATEGGLESVAGEECFLCGKLMGHLSERYTFSPAPQHGMSIAPELPCHADCLIVRGPLASARIYHQRVADLVNVPRVNPVQRMFRRLLLGVR